MLNIIGELLFWREDYKFYKRKKVRREFEAENNLPKKLMIHPVWKLLGIFIGFVLISKIIITYFFFSDFGESSLNVKVSFTLGDSFNARIPKSDIRFEIDRMFRENKITIPFPQRDVRMFNENQSGAKQ